MRSRKPNINTVIEIKKVEVDVTCDWNEEMRNSNEIVIENLR
jgi:hypothetical protein